MYIQFWYNSYFIISISLVFYYSASFSEGSKFESEIFYRVSKLISVGTSFSKQSDNVQKISRNDIKFIFYNRTVREGKVVQNPEDLQGFNINETSKFITHGWLSSGYQPICQTIKNAYLNKTDANIFVVHWGKLANSLMYIMLLQKLELVSDYYADFLKNLIKAKNVQPSTLHLIGHSLGAHISGMVGKRLKEEGPTIGRITGLDPAFPGFHESTNLERLSKFDATFVDVIHTSAGTLGIQESIGHVDFFPNGGVAPMPGCAKLLVKDQCSHSKSWKYFAESISNEFFATRCDSMDSFKQGNCSDSYTEMGEHAKEDTRGSYYLSTNCVHPYSLGINGLKALFVCGS